MAFFIVLVIATVQWFVDGKKNFKGPRIDIDALQNGEVVGIIAEESIESLPPSSRVEPKSKGMDRQSP